MDLTARRHGGSGARGGTGSLTETSTDHEYFGNWDLHVPGTEAGIIDDPTRALDVEWSTESSDVDAHLATAYLPDDDGSEQPA